ncbi:MAG: membrane protein insertase YidC [Sumerlaeia bacterium]
MSNEQRWVLFFLIFITGFFFFSSRSAERARERRAAWEAEQAAAQEMAGPQDEPDAIAAPAPPDGAIDSPASTETPADSGQTAGARFPGSPLDAPRVNVTTDYMEVSLSTKGAVPVSWEILPSDWVAAVENTDTGTTGVASLIPVLRDPGDHEFPLQLEGYTAEEFNNVLFEVEREDRGDATVLRFTSPPLGGVQVTKTYTIPKDSYMVGLRVEVANGESRTRLGRPSEGWGLGWQGGFMQPEEENRLTGQVRAVASVNNDLREKRLDLNDPPVEYTKDVAWAGLERKYFAALLVPSPENAAERLKMEVRERDIASEYRQKGVAAPMTVVLTHEAIDLEPGQRVALDYSVFAGPKSHDLLMEADVPMIAAGIDLERLTFSQVPLGQNWIRPIALGLLEALKWFHNLVGNWGLAIIVLVLVVKIVLYPLSHWAIKNQAKTMAEQQRIRPELDEINRKYKNDPQKKSQEMMRLYREHNINPLGAVRGCFPMLLQMPIFFGLYILLEGAVELRGQSFLWIDDLAQPDRLIPFGFAIPLLGWTAFNILPLLMAGSQYFVSRLMSANISDPMQRQVMVMMPLVFVIFLYNLPSGLMLYWVVQNIWQIGHTILTKRAVEAHSGPPPSAAAAPA